MRHKEKCTVCGKRFNAYSLDDIICPECEGKAQETAYMAEKPIEVNVQRMNAKLVEQRQRRQTATVESRNEENDRLREIFVTKECRCCKNQFAITVGEAEFFKSHELHLPSKCKLCRAKAKQQRTLAK